MSVVSGFSKLSKVGKMQWVVDNYLSGDSEAIAEWQSFWHKEEEKQKILDGFSENTISNFPMPFSVAPNFVINGKAHAVPMVIEESSVVAAAASAAKFWMERGGFHAEVLATTKLGQVHFYWTGGIELLTAHFNAIKDHLAEEAAYLTQRMEQRGGGIKGIELIDFTEVEPNYYQLKVAFETCDSMGANFINSVLEQFAETLTQYVEQERELKSYDLTIIMSILSNYTPDCIVKAWVECPIEVLKGICGDYDPVLFADKFQKAIRIAEIDPHRACTHNKGIYNGVDAVVLATGNDFRAIEACGHTHAARDGQYRSLSHCSIEHGIFRFWLEIPMAIGTVGGLTKLHPLAKKSLEILGQPSAIELMEIIASVGLAQNFAAVKSLITTGIQQGHMKMHLKNILHHLGAKNGEVEATEAHFQDKKISFTEVRTFLEKFRLKY